MKTSSGIKNEDWGLRYLQKMLTKSKNLCQLHDNKNLSFYDFKGKREKRS